MKTRLLITASGVAVAAAAASLALILSSNHEDNPAARAALIVALGLIYVASGLLAIVRRPESRMGVLMALVGLFWFLSSLAEANRPWIYTIGVAVSLLIYGGFAHVILAFPTGRLDSARARAIVVLAYVDVTIVQWALMLFRDHIGVANRRCGDCPTNTFVVTSNHAAATAVDDMQRGVALALLIAASGTLYRRARLATPAARRTLMPVVITATISIALIGLLVIVTAFSASLARTLNWFVLASLAAVPLGFLVALLRSRLARSGILRLVVDTPDQPSLREIELALREATGDPNLRFAYWLDDMRGYVNVRGKPFVIPEDTPLRVTTKVDYGGEPIAAFLHDRALLDDPGLLEEVTGVVRMGLQKDRGERALRATEIQNRALLDAIPDLMFRISLEGRYLDFRAPDEADLVDPVVLGKTVWNRLPKELADRFMEAGRRAIDERAVQTLEYELDVANERRQYEGRIAASGDDEFVLIVRNITKRKRAEEELRREREFLGVVAGATPSFLCAIDRHGRITDRGVNRTFAEALGYDDPEACGRLLTDLIAAPEDRAAMAAALSDAAAGGETIKWHEHAWQTSDGRKLPVAWSIRPLTAAYEDWFLVAGIDVTERKQREEEVRASRARIVAAGDEERRRLERNLHDGAQQRLVSLSLALRLAETKLRSDPNAAEQQLAAAREELGQALEELRELARGIHPAILTDRGLGPALEALAARAPLPVEIERGDGELPPSVEVAAYYVVSEALANIAKYADATNVRVSIAQANGSAQILVADDGVGGADPAVGSGLRGLADRIAALNGTLEVESPPGAGTVIRAEIPLADTLRQP